MCARLISMPDVDNIYEDLSVGECLDLLRTHRFGRLAVVVDGQPLIFPVNYGVDGDVVAFRTAAGTKLSATSLGRVAFEIDGVDETSRTGWSVVVQGVGNDITSTVDTRSEQLRALEVEPWVPGERVQWVGIMAQQLSGRRLRGAQSFER